MLVVLVCHVQLSKTAFNAIQITLQFALYAKEDFISIVLEDVQLAQETVLPVLVIPFVPAVPLALLCFKSRVRVVSLLAPVLV